MDGVHGVGRLDRIAEKHPAGDRAERRRLAQLSLLERRQMMEWWNLHGHQVVSTIIFSFIGIVIFSIFFAILPKVLPFSLKKEMEEDQNVALGIVIGSIIIAIAIIIAASVTGG
jgi:putative membrane protein